MTTNKLEKLNLIFSAALERSVKISIHCNSESVFQKISKRQTKLNLIHQKLASAFVEDCKTSLTILFLQSEKNELSEPFAEVHSVEMFLEKVREQVIFSLSTGKKFLL